MYHEPECKSYCPILVQVLLLTWSRLKAAVQEIAKTGQADEFRPLSLEEAGAISWDRREECGKMKSFVEGIVKPMKNYEVLGIEATRGVIVDKGGLPFLRNRSAKNQVLFDVVTQD